MHAVQREQAAERTCRQRFPVDYVRSLNCVREQQIHIEDNDVRRSLAPDNLVVRLYCSASLLYLFGRSRLKIVANIADGVTRIGSNDVRHNIPGEACAAFCIESLSRYQKRNLCDVWNGSQNNPGRCLLSG